MQRLNYQVKLYSIFFNIDLKCEALNFSSLTDGWPLTPHTVCWDCLVDDKHLSRPHSRIFVLRWIHKYMLTLFNAYLATSQPINSSQTATLSISTLSCQTRKARRTAPAPIMQLTGCYHFTQSPVCLSTHLWLHVSSQISCSAQPASKLIYSDDDSCMVFAATLPCLSRPWIKGHISIRLITQACICHAQHWHVSKIREWQGACSHALSDYARRRFCPAFYIGPTSKTQLQYMYVMQVGKKVTERSWGTLKKVIYDLEFDYIQQIMIPVRCFWYSLVLLQYLDAFLHDVIHSQSATHTLKTHESGQITAGTKL